jgi:hypothetical protein
LIDVHDLRDSSELELGDCNMLAVGVCRSRVFWDACDPLLTTLLHNDCFDKGIEHGELGRGVASDPGFLAFLEYARIVSIVKLEERSIVSGKHAVVTLNVSMTSGGRGTTRASSSL